MHSVHTLHGLFRPHKINLHFQCNMIVSSFANHYGAVATDNSVGITLVFDLSAWFRLRLNAREIQIFKHSMLKIAMITYLVSILTF